MIEKILYALPALLPIIAFASLLTGLQRIIFPWRKAFLITSIVFSLFIVIVNETLSVGSHLTRGTVLPIWVLFTIGTLVFACVVRKDARRTRKIAWTPFLLVGVPMLLVILPVVVIAWVNAPNNWDSLTYHMARIANWIQYQSIAPYPAPIGRQVFMPPLAEWFILHTMLLSGGDYAAQLVQTGAWIGTMIGVSWIASMLGAGKWGQWIAAAICAAIPMSVMQATSTQNDLVNSFFLICFVGLGMDFVRQDRWPVANKRIFPPAPQATWLGATLCGLALGCALLTKGTSLVYVPAFCLWFAIALAPKARWQAIPLVLVIVGVAGLVNAGHWHRNYVTCGKIFGPGKEDPNSDVRWVYQNSERSWRAVLSNASRALALQFAQPDYDNLWGHPTLDQWSVEKMKALDLYGNVGQRNDTVVKLVKTFHEAIGADVNNPKTGWDETAFHVGGEWNSEDIGGQPAVMLLLGATILAWPFPRWRLRWRALIYLLCLLGMLLLFAYVLRWQVWHCRLTLPIVVLATAYMGAAIEQAGTKWVGVPVAWIMLVLCLPFVANNRSKPIFGYLPNEVADGWFSPRSVFKTDRPIRMCFHNRDAAIKCAAVVDEIERRGVMRIGLRSGHDAWEYPLWETIRRRKLEVHIQHIDVINETKELSQQEPFASFRPQMIISINGPGIQIQE